MPGHLLALDDARRIRAGPDGAGTAMLRVAVRVRTAMEAPALHDALEAAALARARDLHDLARREDADGDRIADVVRRNLRLRVARLVETEAAQNGRRRIEPRLLRVTHRRLVRSASTRRALVLLRLARHALLPVSELHR